MRYSCSASFIYKNDCGKAEINFFKSPCIYWLFRHVWLFHQQFFFYYRTFAGFCQKLSFAKQVAIAVFAKMNF